MSILIVVQKQGRSAPGFHVFHKPINLQMMVGLVVLSILVFGSVASMVLVKLENDLRRQAAEVALLPIEPPTGDTGNQLPVEPTITPDENQLPVEPTPTPDNGSIIPTPEPTPAPTRIPTPEPTNSIIAPTPTSPPMPPFVTPTIKPTEPPVAPSATPVPTDEPKPTPQPTQPGGCIDQPVADFDQDCDVDIDDYNYLASWFLRPLSLPLPQPNPDLTGDGQVDIFDYAVLVVNWTGSKDQNGGGI